MLFLGRFATKNNGDLRVILQALKIAQKNCGEHDSAQRPRRGKVTSLRNIMNQLLCSEISQQLNL